jgi:hypothetical protein
MSHHTAPAPQISPGHPPARRLSPLVLGCFAVCLVGALALSNGLAPSHADPAPSKVEIAYVSVLGEGPIARAWYDGAPSPGVPVQDALDHFAEKGYVVVRTTDALRNSTKADESAFAIILQRVR